MAKYKKVKRYHRSFYSPGMWVKKPSASSCWWPWCWSWAGWPRPMCWTGPPTPGTPWCATVTSRPRLRRQLQCGRFVGSDGRACRFLGGAGGIGTGCTRRRHRRGQLGRSGHGCGKGRSFPACRRPAAGPAGRSLRRRNPEGQRRKYPVSLSGAAAAGSIEGASLDPASSPRSLKENGLVPVAKLAAFRDSIAARADRNMAIGYTGPGLPLAG